MLQEIAQQVENVAKSVVSEIHTALPGKIMSFDDKTCLAVVKPIGKYVLDDGSILDYPVISDVPIVFPFCQSSSVGVFFPIKANDECLLIMSETSLDEWRSQKETETALRFDLSNAVAIPGLINLSDDSLKEACEKDGVVIKADETEFVVSKDGISINSDSTQFTISDDSLIISGNVKINGDIECTGNIITADGVNLNTHVHKSATPGSDTGKPE